MKAFLLWFFAIAAFFAFSSVLFGRWHWGHWFGPPSADRALDGVVAVDRYSTIDWDGRISSGRDAITEAARLANSDTGESAWGRLAEAIRRSGLEPRTGDDVSPMTLSAIREGVARRGIRLSKFREARR